MRFPCLRQRSGRPEPGRLSLPTWSARVSTTSTSSASTPPWRGESAPSLAPSSFSTRPSAGKRPGQPRSPAQRDGSWRAGPSLQHLGARISIQSDTAPGQSRPPARRDAYDAAQPALFCGRKSHPDRSVAVERLDPMSTGQSAEGFNLPQELWIRGDVDGVASSIEHDQARDQDGGYQRDQHRVVARCANMRAQRYGERLERGWVDLDIVVSDEREARIDVDRRPERLGTGCVCRPHIERGRPHGLVVDVDDPTHQGEPTLDDDAGDCLAQRVDRCRPGAARTTAPTGLIWRTEPSSVTGSGNWPLLCVPTTNMLSSERQRCASVPC